MFFGVRYGFIELEKIYRQKDDDFIRLLNSIRNRSCTEGNLAELNSCHQPTFEPNKMILHFPHQYECARGYAQ